MEMQNPILSEDEYLRALGRQGRKREMEMNDPDFDFMALSKRAHQHNVGMTFFFQKQQTIEGGNFNWECHYIYIHVDMCIYISHNNDLFRLTILAVIGTGKRNPNESRKRTGKKKKANKSLGGV
tara:strand:- start:63 stop:434 length:372 start_codon:yes stop_codon:yes gene_type:complete